MQYFLSPQVFDNKDTCDKVLSKLFNIIIEAGITSYTFESRHDSTLNATNYLKRDKNYYEILSSQWQRTVSDLSAVFSEVGMWPLIERLPSVRTIPLKLNNTPL